MTAFFEYSEPSVADIKLEVDKVQMMDESSFHLLSPSGTLVGVLRDSENDGMRLKLPKESAEGKIEVQVGFGSVVRLLQEVEVVE